jgi:hypothetical protein
LTKRKVIVKLKTLLETLKYIEEDYGENIEVDLQIAPGDASNEIVGHPAFFVVPEKYDDGTMVNIRSWPY